jgi:GNAT superfamily N-acetyltransferase
MPLRFVLDPDLTGELREEIVTLWTEVSNAGGAVGFAGTVTRQDIWTVAAHAFTGVKDGYDRLLVGYQDGRLVAMLFRTGNRFALAGHWRIVKRVMVRPSAQGRGYGAVLMREAERIARRLGCAALHLTLRGGLGLERFYAALGYKEVGRFPGALRVGPGDDRDEVHMWLTLQ